MENPTTIAQLIPAALNTAKITAGSPTIELSGWRPVLNEYEASLARAADACAKFIADMERAVEPYWLTLSGVWGAGKTMLSRQTYEQAERVNPGSYAKNPVWVTGTGTYDENLRRPQCRWFSASGFKDRMLGGEFDLPEYLRADYLVVIDDLGAARDTRNDALADGLYRLADQRAHKWMIWTTNLSLREISERLDGRISSRMIRDENRLIGITAPDYALRRCQT